MAVFLQSLRPSFQASLLSRISPARRMSIMLNKGCAISKQARYLCGATQCRNTSSNPTTHQRHLFGELSPQQVLSKSARAFTTSNRQSFNMFDSDMPKPHELETPDGRLLYKGLLANIVVKVKFFSYSTSVLGIALMTPIFWHGGIAHYNMFAQVVIYFMSIGFILVSPTVLHYLSKGYVVRLYYDAEKDQYTVVTYNLILREKKVQFLQDDVKVPELRRMFTSFMAKGKGYLVNEGSFYRGSDYDHLMGYDKPFDMEIPIEDVKKEASKE